MTTKQRHRIYKRMLADIPEIEKQGKAYICLCALTWRARTSLFSLPELLAQRPTPIYGGGYWWSPFDSEPRRNALRQAIKQTAPPANPLKWILYHLGK